MNVGGNEPVVVDDAFVAAATIREDGVRSPAVKPSRASLREVKREARQRRRNGGRVPSIPTSAPPAGRWRHRFATMAVFVAIGGVVAWYVAQLPGPPPRRKAA